MKSIHLIAAVTLLASAIQAAQVELNVALGRPVLLADQKQTTYLKVGLTGFRPDQHEYRTPVNVAIVLDRSGSMSGEKLEKAKAAAIMALHRLNRDDIISIVAYDDSVNVLVPATRVSDRENITAAIERLQPGGSTALFAGVSKGAAEVRKFIEKNRVNRVILLSDGIANVGPSSPATLGELGNSLAKEGITVSTIGLGLGYNEDLMTALARQSDGYHAFAENAGDLARIFDKEFGNVLSVCAQEVTIRIRFADGVRPVRALGRDANITGQNVVATLNQLYAAQEKYLLLEVEVPATRDGRSRDIASINVSYANIVTRETDRLTSTVSVRFSDSAASVDKNENRAVMAAAVEQIATEQNKLALQLRDQGQIEEARRTLLKNREYLSENATKYDSDRLKDYGDRQSDDAKALDSSGWGARRKSMRESQYSNQSQQ